MNCTQSQQLLDDYLDGSLSDAQQNTLQAHLTECDDCSHIFEKADKVLSALKNIPVLPARADFEQRMLAFLQQDKTDRHNKSHWFATGFASAFAASFALWLVFSPVSILNTPTNKVQTEKIEVVKLTIQQPRTIDLVFNLNDDLDDATLSLELPDKIQISGYPGEQKLQWKTSFKKGSNRLALPLIATEVENGFLIAKLSKKGKTRVFRIQINSKYATSSRLINSQNTLNG